jgi:hypothetical protein
MKRQKGMSSWNWKTYCNNGNNRNVHDYGRIIQLHVNMTGEQYSLFPQWPTSLTIGKREGQLHSANDELQWSVIMDTWAVLIGQSSVTQRLYQRLIGLWWWRLLSLPTLVSFPLIPALELSRNPTKAYVKHIEKYHDEPCLFQFPENSL